MGPKDFYQLQQLLHGFLGSFKSLDLLLTRAEEEARQKLENLNLTGKEHKKLHSYLNLLRSKKKFNSFYITKLENLIEFIALSFPKGQRLSVYDAEFKVRAQVVIGKTERLLNIDPKIEKFLGTEGALKGVEEVSLFYNNEITEVCNSGLASLKKIKSHVNLQSEKLKTYLIDKSSFFKFLLAHSDNSYFRENRAVLFSLISAAELDILKNSKELHDFAEKLSYQGWLTILCQVSDATFDFWHRLYSSVNANLLEDTQKQNILFGQNFEVQSENIEQQIRINLKFTTKNPRAAFSAYTIFCDYYLCLRQRKFELDYAENSKKEPSFDYTVLLKKEMNKAKKDVINKWSEMGVEDFEQIAAQDELKKLWEAHTFFIESQEQSSVTIINGSLASAAQQAGFHLAPVLHHDISQDNSNIGEKPVMVKTAPRVDADELTKKSAKSKKTVSPWDIDDQRLVGFAKEQITRKSPKRFELFLTEKKSVANDLTLFQRGDLPNTCENVLWNGNNVAQIEQIFKKSSKKFRFFRSERSEIIYKEMTHVRRSYSAVYFLELILKEISSMDFRKKSMFSRRKYVEYTVHDENGYEKKESKLPAFFAEIAKICKSGLAFRKERSPYSAFLEVQQKLFRYCKNIEKSRHRHLPKAQKLLNLVMSEKAKPILEMDKDAFSKFLNIVQTTENNALLTSFYAAIKPFLSTVEAAIANIFIFGEQNKEGGLSKLNKEKSNLVDYVCYKLFNSAERYFSKSQKREIEGAYQTVVNQIKEIFVCNKPGSSYMKISENPAVYFRKEFDDEKKYYNGVVNYLESNIPALIEVKPEAYDYLVRAIKHF